MLTMIWCYGSGLGDIFQEFAASGAIVQNIEGAWALGVAGKALALEAEEIDVSYLMFLK